MSCSKSELMVVFKVVYRSVEGKKILMFVMEESLESTGLSPPTLFVESDIRDLKRDVKELQRTVEEIDIEGGKRLENVDRDLVFLRKQFKRVVKRSENVVIDLIVELEIKVEKLALKVVKMEAATKPSPSSRPDENIN